MTVSGVPHKQLAVQLVSCRDQQLVIMRECQVCHFAVMLTQPEDGSLGVVIPDDDVSVVSLLSTGKEVSLV